MIINSRLNIHWRSTCRQAEQETGYLFIVHMTYVIEGDGALVNEAEEEQPLKAGDFALVDPSEKHQYRNNGDVPFKMICGVPKEFE